MEKYMPRVADKVLRDALDCMGAVVVQGPRWCGKTTTARQIAKSEIRLDDPGTRANYEAMADVSARLLLRGDTPRLIDEWQDIPQIWDAVRHEVDDRGERGQFILTGSVTPPDKSQIRHSGVGRMTKIRMDTMSLFESGESTGEVSLGSLFGDTPSVEGANPLGVGDIAYLICRGGWPASVGMPERDALRVAKDYHGMLVETDMRRPGGVSRNPRRVEAVLRSYSRHICTQARFREIHRDVLANDSETLSEETLNSYVTALDELFVLKEIPAWCPAIRSKATVRTTRTRNFSDPSFAAASLNVTPDVLLGDFETFGLFFESMCMRDLSAYAQYLDADVFHYRDSNGLECDAVVRTGDGRWGAIEIKLGANEQVNAAAANLLKFGETVDTEKMTPPAFLAVLSGTAPYAYRRKDGVYVIPLGCLRY